MKEWQKGIEIEKLSALAAVFKAEYKPYIFGAFGLPKERDLALALDGKNALYTKELDTCLIFTHYKATGHFTDFTGSKAFAIPAGDIMIKDFAGSQKEKVFDALQQRAGARAVGGLWAECFQENAEMKAFYHALGFCLVAVKISAASDLIGVYRRIYPHSRDLPPVSANAAYSEADRVGIKVLRTDYLPDFYQRDILAELDAFGDWAQHYSNYNKGGTWQAFALWGFDDDPFFIIKPSEMSRKWKAENADKLSAQIRATTAAPHFLNTRTFVKTICDNFRTSVERVRFMRLSANVGKLSRHADITDRDAGTSDGKIVRLHVPIQTREMVRFSSWTLDGEERSVYMPERSLCYLDVRKPHQAENLSPTDRIHLVVDVKSNAAIRGLICE